MREDYDADPQLDDQLADYTDRLLQAKGENVEFSSDDPELADLEKTVYRFKSAVQAAQPDEAAVRRIRVNVLREWDQNAGRPRVWRWLRLATFGAAAVLLLGVIYSLTTLRDAGNLTGTAGLEDPGQPVLLWIPIVILIGLIFVIFLRSKRK